MNSKGDFMMKLFSALFVLSVSTAAVAALPPYYQNNIELKAILDSQEVAKKLDSAYITSLNRTGDTVVVATGNCALNVKIVYIKEQGRRVGPAIFRLNVGEVNCLP
jgi:hypothetical protein